jgi:hypothetical protein
MFIMTGHASVLDQSVEVIQKQRFAWPLVDIGFGTRKASSPLFGNRTRASSQ